jgi:hydrogenase maturation protease
VSTVRVIGIGTPCGDDRAGLEVAARVGAAPPRGCEVVATERPGVELIDLLNGGGATIVLDAVRSGAAAGTIHDLPLDDLPAPRLAMSSHGIGIAEALALARALGHRPHGRLIGIEAGAGAMRAGDPLGADVAAAIGAAVQRVHAWIARYCAPCLEAGKRRPR